MHEEKRADVDAQKFDYRIPFIAVKCPSVMLGGTPRTAALVICKGENMQGFMGVQMRTKIQG